MQHSDKPSVLLQNLTVRYREEEEPVLRDISLSLSEGCFYLLSGPSGGGKSTLLHALAGTLTVPEGCMEGKILLNGEEANPDAALRAFTVGSVLQDPDTQIIFRHVEDELSFVLENICLPPEDMKERILSSARAVSLDPSWCTETLSGGEKQRLVTACTLAMKQKILLFDEPLASLDEKGATKLLTLLRRLTREEGYTVLFIEHRIDWVLPYADRFFWLDEGKIQAFDTPSAFHQFFEEAVLRMITTPPPISTRSAECGKALITLENASYAVKKREILKDISFTLREGDCCIVHGENGAGKTTFLKLLTGLIDPTDGRRSSVYTKKERFRHIGFIMQNPSYQLFLPTVEEEIYFQAESKALAEELLTFFGFDSMRKAHPHSLSEGQKRRLGFAAILSFRPEVLLMDEPTVGQDYASMNKMLEALTVFYKDRPLTLITLTHDSRCASFFGDKILHLSKGRLET